MAKAAQGRLRIPLGEMAYEFLYTRGAWRFCGEVGVREGRTILGRA